MSRSIIITLVCLLISVWWEIGDIQELEAPQWPWTATTAAAACDWKSGDQSSSNRERSC